MLLSNEIVIVFVDYFTKNKSHLKILTSRCKCSDMIVHLFMIVYRTTLSSKVLPRAESPWWSNIPCWYCYFNYPYLGLPSSCYDHYYRRPSIDSIWITLISLPSGVLTWGINKLCQIYRYHCFMFAAHHWIGVTHKSPSASQSTVTLESWFMLCNKNWQNTKVRFLIWLWTWWS